MKRIALVLFITISFQFLKAQCDRYLDPSFENFTIHKDLFFGSNIQSNGERLDLYLDVFTPDGDTSKLRPLLIYFHGGTFINGSKETDEAYLICEEFVKRGYVAVSSTYRQEESFLSLASSEQMIKAVFRAVEDVKASIRYFYKDVKDNGNPFQIDTSRIIIGGASAGSIAVLHAIYVNGFFELDQQLQNYAFDLGIDDNLEGNSGNQGYSSDVIGVINVSGALRNKKYLDNNTIPLLSVHNEVDFTIPFGVAHPYQIPFLPLLHGSNVLHNHYKKQNKPTTLYKVPGFGHVPYKNDEGKAQPVFDNTINYMSIFANDLVKKNCEITTPLINYVQQEGDISIMPTITKELLIITFNDIISKRNEKTIRLIDLSGQIVYTSFIEKEKPQASLNIKHKNLPGSIYFVQVIDNKTQKLLKTGKIFYIME